MEAKMKNNNVKTIQNARLSPICTTNSLLSRGVQEGVTWERDDWPRLEECDGVLRTTGTNSPAAHRAYRLVRVTSDPTSFKIPS